MTNPRRSGFALLELCVVLGLVCIIALLTMHSFSFYRRLFLHTELDRLYTLCVATAQHAVINNQTQEIKFDVHNQSYKISHAATTKTCSLPDGIIFGLLPGIKGPPANPKGDVRQPITFEKQCITFHKDGKIQAGTLYLTDTKKQWQYALSCPVGTIPYIRRYRYENKGWKLLT